MQLNDSFSIGVLAGRSGVPVSTIRYYEEIGLLPPARRRESGHRVYGTAQETALVRVKSLRDMGLPLEKVRDFVTAEQQGADPQALMRELARVQLQEVRAQLAELGRFQQRLEQIVATCSAECAGGPASRCTIVKDIAARTAFCGCL